MSLVKKCCICGRICGENPQRADPYKNGYACDKCYHEQVIPSKKWKESKGYRWRYGRK